MNNNFLLSPEYWEEAKKVLSANDAVLAKIIVQYQGERLSSRGNAFFSLARAIVGQQISIRAADSIWMKLETATGKMIPANIIHADEQTLRSCGLSRQKMLYLRELALFFLNNPDNDWYMHNDAAVVKRLVSIKGIGKWSAEMFLIFHLLRPDVFPIADIGLQKAIERHYNAGGKMPVADMTALSEQWRPYRTVATWYLWRSLDPVPVEY